MTVELIYPPSLRSSEVRFYLNSNTEVARSIFTNRVTSVERAGDFVKAALSLKNASNRAGDRAIAEGFLARMRGQLARIWISDPSYVCRGSFPDEELLSNNLFLRGTFGWTSSSANLVLSSNDRTLRAFRAGVSSDYTIRASSVVTESGATYAARVFVYAGRGPMDYRLRIGTSAGGAEISASGSDYTSAGLRTLVGAASGSATHFSILDGTSSRAIGNYMDFGFTSLSRCMLIDGGSQTGPGYAVSELPESESGLLLTGDWVQIGNVMRKVVSPLDSDASGLGYLRLHAPLKAAPADGDPVIVNKPMGLMVATSNSVGWSAHPGGFADFDMEFAEALA